MLLVIDAQNKTISSKFLMCYWKALRRCVGDHKIGALLSRSTSTSTYLLWFVFTPGPIFNRTRTHKSLGLPRNHRMFGVGRDLQGSSSPTPPAKAGSPTAGCTGPRPDRSWVSPEKEQMNNSNYIVQKKALFGFLVQTPLQESAMFCNCSCDTVNEKPAV